MLRKLILTGLATVLGAASPAFAAPVGTTTDAAIVALSGEIGARIRWGGTGFEASVYDSNPLNQNPQLNPSGAPVWAVNTAYGFQVSYVTSTGEISLSVDFNDDNSFSAAETVSRTVFAVPGLTNYAGNSFQALSISGNESGSTARSQVTNLSINGTAQSSLVPGGASISTFYRPTDNSLLGNITLTGDITFLTAGTAQERPSWNFVMHGPEIPANPDAVPAPASLAVLGIGLLGLAVARRARPRA